MALAKLKNFRLSEYELGSRPSIDTLKRHIKARKLPGGYQDKHTGQYWVDMDVYRAARRLETMGADLLEDPRIRELVGVDP